MGTASGQPGKKKVDDRALLAETLADVPGVSRPRGPAGPESAARDSARSGNAMSRVPGPGETDALAETAADMEAIREPVRAGRGQPDVDLEQVFDRPVERGESSLSRFDPEAGKLSAAAKARHVRQQVSASIGSPFGRLIFGIVLGLAGVAVGIMAAIEQTPVLIGIAAVLTPLGLWVLHVRYRAWLGHRRYMYRLLEQLGEDVSGFDARKAYRPVKRR